MLIMNLQLFGGRGSAGGNNPAGSKATEESKSVYNGKEVNKLTKAELTRGLDYTSKVGDMKSYNMLDKEAKRRGTSGYKLLSDRPDYLKTRGRR